MVTIAHASVAGAEDRVPFEHALVLAERSGAKLISVHASGDPGAQARMIAAADVLREWGRDASAVEHVRHVHDCCPDPVDTVLDFLRRVEPDLVVAGAHQRRGATRIFAESRSEAIAENVRVPTLTVPLEGRAFVRGGALELSRLVVPAGDGEAAAVGMERAAWLADLARAEDVTVELLFVGEAGEEPALEAPRHPRIRWTTRTVGGDFEEAVTVVSAAASAIVMATRGQDSLRDALLGTHTERVMRIARCPVLSVPIER